MAETIKGLVGGTMLEHPQTPFRWQDFASYHGRSDLAVRHTTRFGYDTRVIRVALAGQGMALVPRQLIAEKRASGRLSKP